MLRFLVMWLICGSALAQSFPTKPIKIINPFPPGAAELIARITADHFNQVFDQRTLVEGVTGAGGILAAERMVKSVPDGHTLMVGSTSVMSVNGSLYKNLGYNQATDFAPISLIIKTPNYILVNAKLPIYSMKELIAYAKQNPGRLSYSTAGIGTSAHMNIELIKNLTNTFMVPIHYRGSVPASLALISGDVDLMSDIGPTALPQIRAGRVRALAVTTSKRTQALPDVPTVSETGLSGFDTFAWFGIVGPAGMPPEIVSRLHKEIQQAFASAEIRSRFETMGSELVVSTPEEFSSLHKKEIAKWSRLIRESGIRPE